MFEIVPVTMTVTDWTRFVAGSNRLINRSPTRGLDSSGMDVGVPSSLIPALLEFSKKGSDPRLRSSSIDRVLEHMSFGFLVSTSAEILKWISTDGEGLKILLSDPSRHKENYIITGSLRAWKISVVHFCSDSADVEIREFFNAIWEFFNRAGFTDIFGSYKRKDLNDKTWALEIKR